MSQVSQTDDFNLIFQTVANSLLKILAVTVDVEIKHSVSLGIQ